MDTPDEFTEVWGPYPIYDDISRLVYGRRFWRDSLMRKRLLSHWQDERHPYRERFRVYRPLIEEALQSTLSDKELDLSFRQRNTSLRCVTREIPPVFGSFWDDSQGSRAFQGTACASVRDS
jgi:hypothetical protein